MVSEAEKAALAALLIEIAFLLRGTSILLHPISNKLITYVAEVRKSVRSEYGSS